jgi:hypothetical protein
MNENIWALAKHQEIKHLLLLLVEQLGGDAFAIDVTTPLDEQAIYLHHRENAAVRAYIYTVGQQPERYGVHFEFPNSVEPHENIALAALVEMLAVHFDVAVIRPLPY